MLDRTGIRYGKLVVVYKTRQAKEGQWIWLCKCDCGKTKEIRGGNLTGGTKSCGCLVVEAVIKSCSTSASKNKRLYVIYTGMLSRCNNKKRDNYNRYGEKGIKVCDDWLDYEVFYAWATSNGYSNNLTIERKDTTRGYCEDNCEWMEAKYQTRNRRKQENTASKYIGVSFNRNKWVAEIMEYGKNVFRQRFDTQIEAAKERDKFILSNNMKKYRLNFPGETNEFGTS